MSRDSELRQHLLGLVKRHEEIRGYWVDEKPDQSSTSQRISTATPQAFLDLDDVKREVKQIAANTDWPRFFKALSSLRVQVTTATAAIGAVLANGGFQWNDRTSMVVTVALTAWGAYLAFLDAQRKIGV